MLAKWIKQTRVAKELFADDAGVHTSLDCWVKAFADYIHNPSAKALDLLWPACKYRVIR